MTVTVSKEKTTPAARREYVCPVSESFGVPTGYGQKDKHMESMTYDQMMELAETAGIGHPYFDVRFSVYQNLFLYHLNLKLKALPRQRQQEELPRLIRLGFRAESKVKKTLHKFWMATAADPRI